MNRDHTPRPSNVPGRVRADVDAAFARLNLPASLTLDGLIRIIEADRGTNIDFVENPLLAQSGVCGLWLLLTDGRHEVHVPPSEQTTPHHNEFIRLHELAHMALNHRESPLADAYLTMAFEGLDLTKVKQALGRGGYGSEIEQAAELLAEKFATAIRNRPREQLHFERYFG